MFRRLRNLIELSKLDVNVKESKDGEVYLGANIVQSKPEKRPAIILEDTPPEQFPTEEPENI